MRLSDFRTTNVDNAVKSAWADFRKASSSPHFGGCGVAPTPSEFATNYACLVQLRKAVVLGEASAKAHLCQRAINQVELMTEASLLRAMKRELEGIPGMPVPLEATNTALREAQEFFGLDEESRPIQLSGARRGG